MRRILFFAPGWSGSQWPHYGLVLLASQLKKLGHPALVVDYNYTPDAPTAIKAIEEFKPDVIGVSLYTINMSECRRLIANIRSYCDLPIMVGGPHATIYQEELAREKISDWLFAGEAEKTLSEYIELVKREKETVIVKELSPDISNVPPADFNLAWGGYSRMFYRPIQLSRGCPFSCSFCSVKCITTRSIRYRDMDLCLDELRRDIAAHPKLTFVRIVDDCPTLDKTRFMKFLEKYEQIGIGRSLHIDNLRGDTVDDELLTSLKRIGVDHLCLGVETANPAVFKSINKGETLDEIVQAALLIKRHKIRLYLCFVIGLPEATPETDRDSIALAEKLKPNWIFWNQFQPHKGTQAREWFERHGVIYSEEGKTSLIGIDLMTTEPPCETPDYSRQQRVSMQLKAVLLSGCYALNPFWSGRMCRTVARHRLWLDLFYGLGNALRINVEMMCHRVWRQFKTGQWIDLSLFKVPKVIRGGGSSNGSSSSYE